MATSDWKQVPSQYNFKCRQCSSKDIKFCIWTSYDEAHEDYRYHCNNCARDWWAEGSDY